MKEQHIKISFSGHGYLDQDILITDDAYTADDVIAGLKSGDMITTIQEDGDVVDISNGQWKTIGTVVATDSQLEYRLFHMDDSYELVATPAETFDVTRLALSFAMGEFSPDTDISVKDFMSSLEQAGDEVPGSHVFVSEQYELLTGNQLISEIKEFAIGLESIMKVAHAAGKTGKEII